MKTDNFKNIKIMISYFLILVLLSGAARLSSIYFVESITRYDVDRKQASFPFVLTFIFQNSSGLLAGYLEQIFGMKWIIVSGCIIATLGIGGCFFAEEILAITILWGVILGHGYGFVYNMQAPLLSHYFKKNKNIATGFVLAGSSIGGAVMPPIAVACIKTFGTSGSFLVLSAIIAHCIPASLLLEKPIVNSLDNISKGNTEIKYISDSKKNKNLSNISNNVDNLCLEQIHKSSSSSTVETVLSEDRNISNPSLKKKPETGKHHINELCTDNLPLSVSLPKVSSTQVQGKNKKLLFNKKKFTFRNFRIFFDPAFIVILIINGLNAAVIITVWTLILDFVRDKGVLGSLEIYFVILLPLTDIVGRLSSGYIADKKFLNSSHFCFIMLIVQATALIAMVYLNNFIMLMVCEIVLSTCFGFTIMLTLIVVDDFMEESLKTMAQSCRGLLGAPLSFIISPMLGYFRGGYGSYDYVFYILSGVTLFCGVSACFIPYLARRRQPLKTIHI